MEFVFVLVEPAGEQNIGASARALNTMGFDRLRLVDPQCNYLSEDSRLMAHGSAAILDHAQVFPALVEALEDVNLSVGTTARHRKCRQEYCPVGDVAAAVRGKGKTAALTAIVFGCEEHGLSNSDLALCDLVSCIPMRSRHPSLNLAQAVMLYAYELSPLVSPKKTARKPDPVQYSALRGKVDHFLDLVNIPHSSNIHKRLIQRLALLQADDLHLLHSMLNKVNSVLKNTP